jgi:hypothetical protein
MPSCETCGVETSEHDRQVRFLLPDPVLDLPDRERTEGTWLSHEDPNTSVMMQVPQVGDFVRALLPVRLMGGYTVTYGVWVGVRREDLRHAYDVWWDPSYPELKIEGVLANTVQPWGLLGSPVSLAVLDPDATPYCVASSDPDLSDVLSRVWRHQQILETLP